MPAFDPEGGLLLACVRTASVCALLSVFGALVFRIVVAPRSFACMAADEVGVCRRALLVLVQASAAAGLAANLAWLCVQAADMADAHAPMAALRAVPLVATGTVFGRVLLAQSLCLAGTIGVVGLRDQDWRQRGGLCLAALALCLQAGHGHAWSMYGGPSVLLAFDVLHLLGAGAWLGGLLPLLIFVWRASPRAAAVAARWFSPLGQWCIAALVVSAGWQGFVLIGSLAGFLGTSYGFVALGKVALFVLLLGFAAVNRYWFAPALAKVGRQQSFFEKKDQKTFGLLGSLTLQTCAAVGIVAVAALLSELPPAMHDQAHWPFAQRFSLDAVREDPDFRREVLTACAALCLAGCALTAAFIMRRWRGVAFGVAAVTVWLALPHLDLLLVPAYPTSFYHSPTGFTAASIVQGQGIYARHCLTCHGADGRGDHRATAALAVPPADLTAAHLWMHSDGELYWWVSHGIATPEGALAMPGFADVLNEDARWAVIDFIRARNAGAARRGGGAWTHTIQAPDFAVTCGAASPALSELRGHFVLLRFGASAARDAAVTVLGEKAVPSRACITDDGDVTLAYAVVSGLDGPHLAGSAFLIDGQGWLRAMQMPGDGQNWGDPAFLAAEIATLEAQTLGVDAPMKMPM